jgi:hypothetical protein
MSEHLRTGAHPLTSRTTGTPERPALHHTRLTPTLRSRPMKKVLLLVVVAVLATVAAKKVRAV